MSRFTKQQLNVGDTVLVKSVRSNIINFPKGIGWFANNVVVTVGLVHDLTFEFTFNGEKHLELIDDVKKVNINKPALAIPRIEYGRDCLDFKLKQQYGI